MSDDKENISDAEEAVENHYEDKELPYIMPDFRLETFGEKGLWFEVGSASRFNMVNAGFYCPDDHARGKRTVRCAYCRVEFREWKRNDDPQKRHLAESPDCAFAMLGKEENELTVRQIIELELYARLRFMEEKKNEMKALVLDGLSQAEQLILKH